jgi:hypothetical protein
MPGEHGFVMFWPSGLPPRRIAARWALARTSDTLVSPEIPPRIKKDETDADFAWNTKKTK